MFEAVYIADTNNNLIYEYLITLLSPSFKSLLNIVNSGSQPNDIIEINKKYSVYKITTTNVVIYTLNVSNINPLLPYNFIVRLIEVIHDYFGFPLAISKVEANNETLTLLINQMLDDGIPIITDFNKLRDIIPFKSFLSKILSKTNEITNNAIKTSSPQLIQDLTEQIPWRRSNVRHTNNEMYVDLIETVDIILQSTTKNVKLSNQVKQFDSAFYSTSSTNLYNKNLVPISGTISGQVNFTCKLTGVPLLQLILNKQGLKDISPRFHRSVKIDNWDSQGTLSLIPPDGKFQLMTYTIDMNQFDHKNQMSMLGSVNVEYNYGLGANKNDFEIKLNIPIKKGVSKIENLTVEVFTNYPVNTIKSNRLTHGDFSYKGDGRAEWNLRSVSTGVTPIFYGSILTKDNEDDETTEEDSTKNTQPIKPTYIKLSYNNKGSLASGIKVDSLKILSAKGMSDTVKPYKGVKYITQTGDFIVRS